uniref:Mesothelin like n=1 Tax=Anas platyrhynchos platyrhynchos TaxID=8840 RepID=A0A493T5W6_ANAPP
MGCVGLGMRPPAPLSTHCSEGRDALKQLSKKGQPLCPCFQPPPPHTADSCSPQCGRGARRDLQGVLFLGCPREPGAAAPGLSTAQGNPARGSGLCGEWGRAAGSVLGMVRVPRAGHGTSTTSLSQGASGSRLSLEQLGSLRALVCDMEPDTITASDPGILENLKLCSALMESQRGAVNAVLLGGGTPCPTWCSSSITAITCPFHRAFLGAVRSHDEISARCRGKMLTPELCSPPAGCTSTTVTPSTPFDNLITNYESPEQFYLCLSDLVLQNSLKRVLEQPLPMEYLQMVKKKLLEIYPAGIPEEQLRLLGPLSRQFSAQEIRQWQVNSSDTLYALLMDGTWNTEQLIARYLELGGKLTGPLLQRIGGSCLCSLSEEQIKGVTPEAIGAGELDISSCSQSKKDQLYRTAREAFAGQACTQAYYDQIQPYLGGAPVKDLKDLANAGITISMDTFLALNPKELQKLSVMDVKNLLGTEVEELKKAENQTAVLSWIKKQCQEELDRILGICLPPPPPPPPPHHRPPHFPQPHCHEQPPSYYAKHQPQDPHPKGCQPDPPYQHCPTRFHPPAQHHRGSRCHPHSPAHPGPQLHHPVPHPPVGHPKQDHHHPGCHPPRHHPCCHQPQRHLSQLRPPPRCHRQCPPQHWCHQPGCYPWHQHPAGAQ